MLLTLTSRRKASASGYAQLNIIVRHHMQKLIPLINRLYLDIVLYVLLDCCCLERWAQKMCKIHTCPTDVETIIYF